MADALRSSPTGIRKSLTVGSNHHPFVEQRVLLESAVEVVSKRGIRSGRRAATAGNRSARGSARLLCACSLDRLLPRCGRPLHGPALPAAAGHIALDTLEDASLNARHDLRLPRMVVELLQQFEIGEAQADSLHLHKNFVRPGRGDGFRRVKPELTGANKLHRMLYRWEGRCCRHGKRLTI